MTTCLGRQADSFSSFYIDEYHSYSNSLNRALAQYRYCRYCKPVERPVACSASLAIRSEDVSSSPHGSESEARLVSSTDIPSLDDCIRVRSIPRSAHGHRRRSIRRRRVDLHFGLLGVVQCIRHARN